MNDYKKMKLERITEFCDLGGHQHLMRHFCGNAKSIKLMSQNGEMYELLMVKLLILKNRAKHLSFSATSI